MLIRSGIILPKPNRYYPRSKLISDLPTSLQLFTVTEVAIILGVQADLVNKWIADGTLPFLQLGKEKFFTRVRAQDLETFIDTQIRVGNIKITKQ